MALVKALCTVIKPGKSGKLDTINPGEEFESFEAELADLIKLNAVTVLSEDSPEPVATKRGRPAKVDADLVQEPLV